MTAIKILVILIGSVAFGPALTTQAQLTKEQIYPLFNQANEAFRQANSMADDPDQTVNLYKKAILLYEKIIDEGQIKNAGLYYNLANAYFLKEDIGRAVLNYRRAEKLDSSDENIQKNLRFARSKRLDKIASKTQKRILQTLFFWHYDFSLETKFILTCFSFAAVCVVLTVMTWRGSTGPAMATAVVAGILMSAFLVSLVLEAQHRASTVSGVITAKEVVAHQGDSQNYPPSFKDPLHAGTEFDLLERRAGWLHIKLADDSDGWIPEAGAELI